MWSSEGVPTVDVFRSKEHENRLETETPRKKERTRDKMKDRERGGRRKGGGRERHTEEVVQGLQTWNQEDVMKVSGKRETKK